MKIAVDSDSLPAETRRETWRRMLCDTYMGMDCRLPGDFRSVIEGYSIGEHTLTRVTSSHHDVNRSPTLIRRDGLELIFFGVLLAGQAIIVQGGRETTLERGAVVISDSSRPSQTYVDHSADIIWLSVPKRPIADRLRGVEDLIAMSLRPARPIEKVVTDMMTGFDEALTRGVPAHEADTLVTRALDLLAMTITSSGWPPRPSFHLMPRPPLQ